MKVEILEKYGCGSCGEWFSEKDDDNDQRWPHGAMDAEEAARDHCAPPIERAYFCSICDKTFDRWSEAKKHKDVPHSTSKLDPHEQYVALLVEGLPPLVAYKESHSTVIDDRRIVEEVLLGEAIRSYL